jgi:fibronectin-binding autotransporter adhesin
MKKNLLKLQIAAAAAALLAAVQSARAQTVWIGTNNVSATTNWSDFNNWSTLVVPGSGDGVKFADPGALDNPVSNINNVVDSSIAIASLHYANTNGSHTTFISAGQILTVSGSLTNGTDTDNGNALLLTNAVTGPGALVVNASGGQLIVRQATATGANGSLRSTLNLSGLNTFSATVGRVFIGASGPQSRPVGTLYLARTNTITASGSAPAIQLGGDGASPGNAGGGSFLYLGQTNAVFANTITTARTKQGSCSIRFNPDFIGSSPTAWFRGAAGDPNRVTTWSIADSGTGTGTVTTTGTNDFTGGTVNALVDTIYVARTSQSTSASAANGNPVGTLTFDAGIIDVNTLRVGYQSSTTLNLNNIATGTVNINGTARLIVNTSLELGHIPAGANLSSRGIININGGTLTADTIVADSGSTNNSITVTGGTLAVTNSAGPGINNFTISDSTLALPALNAGSAMVVTNLTTGGTTNIVNILAVPVLSGYPAQLTLVQYSGAIGGAGFNFGMGTFPAASPAYAGYISNNTTSIDLVITNGPVPAKTLSWKGQPANGDWDVGVTANWTTNGVNTTTYHDADFVNFNDSATGTTTVNLKSALLPTSITVSNISKTYTFSGTGYLTGSMDLTKDGSGTLILDNSTSNNFTGGVSIDAGTVQVGVGDFGNGSGNLGNGGVNNNGAIAFNRLDDVFVGNAISGGGSLSQNGSGTLTLSGANSFTGAVTVTAGMLRAGSGAALGDPTGTTTINAGSTLDVNAQNLGSEQVLVQGMGYGYGAIVNNNTTNQTQALRFVTLTGDTYFGGAGRWDIRGSPAALLTSPPNSAFKITKVGVNQVSLVAVTNIDPALGDIDVKEGIFGIQTSTTQLGDSNATITVFPGATLDMYNLSTPLNKNIVLQDSATLINENGRSTIVGPVTLEGNETINVLAAGTNPSLLINSAVGGFGQLIKNGPGTLVLNAATNHYSGGTTVNGGELVLNGVNDGGGNIYVSSGVLAGNGTNVGSVDIVGGATLLPGDTNVVGTFGSIGDMTVEPAAVALFDLGATTDVGGGTNDLVQVNGDLTLSAVNIYINPLAGKLATNGTYRLFNYTGSLILPLENTVQLAQYSPRFTLSLNTNTAGQVNLKVTGSNVNLRWAGTDSSVWDVGATANWFNQGTSSSDVFYGGDTVLFDDTAGVTNTMTIDAGVVVTPYAITNLSTNNNFTISGAGRISGVATLVKQGPSTLTLATTNDFSGTVTVAGGILKLAANSALGSGTGATIVTNGGTLDLNAIVNTNEPVIVSGAGVGGNGAIVSTSTNRQLDGLRTVTMMGDTTIGGTGPWAPSSTTNFGRWDIRSSSSATPASLSTGGHAYQLTKRGSNQISLVNVAVDAALGEIDIQEGALGFEGGSSIGNPASNLTVRAGATLLLWGDTNLLDKHFVFNGDGVTMTVTNGSAVSLVVGPITLNGSCFFGIGGTALTNYGSITGTGSLTKTSGGVLALAGTNTYGGSSTVNQGTLALVQNGAISNSAAITIASGATVDVNDRADGTWTLSNGQLLQGNGRVNGNLTVNANATVSPGLSGIGTLSVTTNVVLLGTNVMEVSKSPTVTNDLITGAQSITYGGTLQVSVLAGTLAANDSFKLFNATNYSGSFNSIVPLTPDTGLLWDTNSLTVDGTLKVKSAVQPVPGITNVVILGTNIVFRGTNGSLGGNYYVLASTNVTLPLSNWTRIATNAFESNGNFSSTNGMDPAKPELFYILQLP